MNAFKIALSIGCVVLVGASCRPATGPSTPAPVVNPPLVPAPLPAANAKLPPVPEVRGPLQIHVQYPSAGQLLTARDSNFIFGNVGTGDAALTINGVPTPVWPNGAFMGWLPVPKDSAPQYVLVAATKTERAQLVVPVKIPPAPDTTTKNNVVGDTLGPVTPTDSAAPAPLNVFVALGAPASTVNDTDRVTIARPAPGNGQEYKWFLLPGTIVRALGTRNPGS